MGLNTWRKNLTRDGRNLCSTQEVRSISAPAYQVQLRSNSLKAPSVNDRRGSDSPLQDGSESPVFVPLRRKSSKRRNVPSVIAPLGVVTPDQHGADSVSSSGIPGRLLLTPLHPLWFLSVLSPCTVSHEWPWSTVTSVSEQTLLLQVSVFRIIFFSKSRKSSRWIAEYKIHVTEMCVLPMFVFESWF